MKQTVTAQYRIYVEDKAPLIRMAEAYRDACNHVSEYVFSKGKDHIPSLRNLHDELYRYLRTEFSLKSQMAQSVMRTVIARYSTLSTQIRDSEKEAERWDKRKEELEAKGRTQKTKRPKVKVWKQIRFHNLQCDLVSDRDWSLVTPCSDHDGIISVNTLDNRIRCAYTDKGYEHYRECRRGTAKLVIRDDGKVFLHVPIEREVPDIPEKPTGTVVGIDRGIRYHAVTYDGKDTAFYPGHDAAKVRARYKSIRRSLQKRKTPSSRRRMKLIGQKEHRWMHDVNSCIAKTLLADLEQGSAVVMEDLSGVRGATEEVRRKDRYVMVSWPYHDLQNQIEYKAGAKGVMVVYVDPRHTSQTCPHCGNVDRNARHRERHEYICPKCGFRTNDDRAAAMNIRERGMDKLNSKGTGISGIFGRNPEGCSQPPHDATSPVCPSASAERETAGIKAGRPLKAVSTGGQSQTPQFYCVGS